MLLLLLLWLSRCCCCHRAVLLVADVVPAAIAIAGTLNVVVDVDYDRNNDEENVAISNDTVILLSSLSSLL
jgi:4-hydroxybenzoate polyprenyltransferase